MCRGDVYITGRATPACDEHHDPRSGAIETIPSRRAGRHSMTTSPHDACAPAAADPSQSAGAIELRALLDETSELVCASGPTGRLTYVNRAWQRTLGYTPAEASELEPVDFVAPEH